jgi:hypothetical protein
MTLRKGDLLRGSEGRELVVMGLTHDLVKVGILDTCRQVVQHEYWPYGTLTDGYKPVERMLRNTDR